MAISKIKKEFANKRVAFGNSGARLSERKDIDELAIIALESKNPSLLMLFEVLPDLETLKKKRARMQIAKKSANRRT